MARYSIRLLLRLFVLLCVSSWAYGGSGIQITRHLDQQAPEEGMELKATQNSKDPTFRILNNSTAAVLDDDDAVDDDAADDDAADDDDSVSVLTNAPSEQSPIVVTRVPTAAPIVSTSPPTKSRSTNSPTVEDWHDKIKNEEEEVVQIVQNQTAEILAGIIAFSGLMGMILTAYMILNYPDGICTSCCQLAIRLIQLIRKLVCLPCDLIRYRGYTSSEAADRSMFLERAVEHTSDLELV